MFPASRHLQWVAPETRLCQTCLLQKSCLLMGISDSEADFCAQVKSIDTINISAKERSLLRTHRGNTSSADDVDDDDSSHSCVSYSHLFTELPRLHRHLP